MNQLKVGALLNYVVLGLNSLIGLLYTPYMLRMMGQSEYGIYSLAASVIAYLTIMDCGFGNAIIRYTAKFRAEGKFQEQHAMFGMFFILYSIIGIVAFLIGIALYLNIDSLFISTMTPEELSRVRIMILILSFNLAVTFPFSIYNSIITAYEDFVFQKVVNIARIIFNTVVMICLLEMGYKAIAMVVVQTVFNLTTLLLNLFYCKYKIHIQFIFRKFRWEFLREVAVYSFWIFLSAIIDRVYWSTGQFVLGAVKGTVAVAVFAVVIQLGYMYISFSTAISGVFLPKVSAMVTKNVSNKEISDLFIRTGRIQYIVMAYILSGFIVFGKAFITIWAGEGYEDAYIMTLFFFVSLTIPAIQNVGVTILQARNQMRFRTLLYLVIAVVSLIMQIVLSRLFGGIGCAIAIAGALFLGQGIVMNFYYQRVQHLDIRRFWREIGNMSFVPIILTMVGCYILPYIDVGNIYKLGVVAGAFSILYVLLLWPFGISSYERNLFRQPLVNLYHRISRI